MAPPSRLARAWLPALVLSVLLHGLGLLAFWRLPGPPSFGEVAATSQGTVDPGLADPPEDPEPITFLVRPRLTRKPPALAAPAGNAAIDIALPSAAPAPSPGAEPGPAQTGNAGEEASVPPGGAQGAGHGAGGPSFFDIPFRAEKVVYVIDRSGSMAMHGALAAARRELLASLERLPPAAFFQVIIYSSAARLLLPSPTRWLQATPENRCLAADALARLEPDGSTCHDKALPLALSLRPDVVFFLTDADDLTEQHVRHVTDCNYGRAVIHAVELSTANRLRPGMPLQTLARDNHGVYRAVDLGTYR
jgi:hypothetical protein